MVEVALIAECDSVREIGRGAGEPELLTEAESQVVIAPSNQIVEPGLRGQRQTTLDQCAALVVALGEASCPDIYQCVGERFHGVELLRKRNCAFTPGGPPPRCQRSAPAAARAPHRLLPARGREASIRARNCRCGFAIRIVGVCLRPMEGREMAAVLAFLAPVGLSQPDLEGLLARRYGPVDLRGQIIFVRLRFKQCCSFFRCDVIGEAKRPLILLRSFTMRAESRCPACRLGGEPQYGRAMPRFFRVVRQADGVTPFGNTLESLEHKGME